MNPPPLQVLYEDNHLLVVNKPAGLPTMGTPEGKPTLLTLAKEYVKAALSEAGQRLFGRGEPAGCPGDRRCASGPDVESRRPIDRAIPQPTRREKLLGRGRRRFGAADGSLVDWLAHDDRHRRMHIVGPTLPGAEKPGSRTDD